MKFLCLMSFMALCILPLWGIESERLQKLFQGEAPFSYPLNITVLKSENDDAKVMLCLHGFGNDHTMVNNLRTYPDLADYHLISFDFPDAKMNEINYDPTKTTFGTIQELLPPLYLIKKCIIDGGLKAIDLYGFSAGGGALVNTLAVLNGSLYDTQLLSVGITVEDKKIILEAIQKGIVILDCPLKSLEEVNALNPRDSRMQVVAQRFVTNNFRPIDATSNLKGLTLNIILYFQMGDEALSNRDDALFISNLKAANNLGKTEVLIGTEGSHSSFHFLLWQAFAKWKNNVN